LRENPYVRGIAELVRALDEHVPMPERDFEGLPCVKAGAPSAPAS